MGTTRNVDMSANQDVVKVVEAPDEAGSTSSTGDTASSSSTKTKSDGRSKRYQSARSQVDKTRTYDAFSAIELLKRMSYSKFDGTVVADLVVREVGDSANVTFPHSTGKVVRVAVVTDELLAEIEAGKIEFDILLSSPQFMPKLAKLAKILGPRGLMPNPKNGTLTDKTEAKKKELEGGKVTVRTEKKAPLVHVVIGKVSMDTTSLVENLQTLLKGFKGKVLKAAVAASMSPSVKISVE